MKKIDSYYDIKKFARDNRKNMTPQERLVWEQVRNRRYLGYKFLRQHPISYREGGKDFFFIADFYCAALNLVLEIDGEYHDNQKEYDEYRDLVIQQKGLHTLRIKNAEIDQNIDLALEKIKEYIKA